MYTDWRMERKMRLRESLCSEKMAPTWKLQQPLFFYCRGYRPTSFSKAELSVCGSALLLFISTVFHVSSSFLLYSPFPGCCFCSPYKAFDKRDLAEFVAYINMGNCWGSGSSDRDATSHVYSSTNLPTTPGTSNNCSNNMESSVTSSISNSRSQFSVSVSEIVEEEVPDGQILETSNLKVFTFAELKAATKSFNTLLGEGGFGKVYKGWLDERTLTPSKVGFGMIVAIKKLKQESVQGFEEWQSEVNFLGRLSHPNLVKLLGYCWEDKELLLVYEFMQKGSLENHLFRRNPSVEPLSWETRLKIIIGAARGLAFLHFSEKVIFRDFKASNILLDGHYNAKISDFGLAKLGPSGGDSHVTTRVMGTYGYAAPEYIATGHLYVKSDVYGFGALLLEIMTGLRALDTKRPDGQQNLVDWLKPTLSHKRKFKTFMDARIEGQYSSKAATQTAELTLKCLEHDPKNRPSMKQVVEALERIESLNKEKPKESSKSGSIHSSTTARHRQQSSNQRPQFHSRQHGVEQQFLQQY